MARDHVRTPDHRRTPDCTVRNPGGNRGHTAPGLDLDGTAALVARVAAMIPPPGEALCADDASWQAFSGLVGEAAGLVVSAVGDTGAPVLRALMTSPLGDDPVPRLLLERALGSLPGHDHRR